MFVARVPVEAIATLTYIYVCKTFRGTGYLVITLYSYAEGVSSNMEQ